MFIVINEEGKYYTNDLRKFDGDQPFLWSSHKQLAKQYAKRGWAERVAEKVEGFPTIIERRAFISLRNRIDQVKNESV